MSALPHPGAIAGTKARGEPVGFYSDGLRLSGVLFLPSQPPAPGVVLCHGFTGVKERYLPAIAARIAEAGYAVLTFDYRCFGQSEGPHWRINPYEQVEDIHNALSYLASRSEVHPSALGLIGFSLGGGHAVQAAAFDERVRCVLSVAGVGDGHAWLRELRPTWKWRAFMERVQQARTHHATTGKRSLVHPLEIMEPDPASQAVWEARNAANRAWQCRLPLETAEWLVRYCPRAVASEIAPRAAMWVYPENDDLVAPHHSVDMFRGAGEPKRLLSLPQHQHYDVYVEPALNAWFPEAMHWFARFLPVEGRLNAF